MLFQPTPGSCLTDRGRAGRTETGHGELGAKYRPLDIRIAVRYLIGSLCDCNARGVALEFRVVEVNNRRVSEQEVYRFIYETIDSVPHLEVLLQLWSNRPRQLAEADLASRLFLTPATLHRIMDDLIRRGLAARVSEGEEQSYCYQTGASPNDDLVAAVADTYKRELIRVTRAIHQKTSPRASGEN